MQLMVDANDDPSTPAYKQIEEMVEAQVCVIQQVAAGPTCRVSPSAAGFDGCQMLLSEPAAGYWHAIHKWDSISALIISLHDACMAIRKTCQLMRPAKRIVRGF